MEYKPYAMIYQYDDDDAEYDSALLATALSILITLGWQFKPGAVNTGSGWVDGAGMIDHSLAAAALHSYGGRYRDEREYDLLSDAMAEVISELTLAGGAADFEALAAHSLEAGIKEWRRARAKRMRGSQADGIA